MPISADQSREDIADRAAAAWIDLAREPEFALGGARVIPALCELVFDGRRIRLQRRVMQVLTALARAEGQLTTRASLIERCWAGRSVGDDAINRCVQRLRRVAEDEAPGAFVIETVPGLGYRLTTAALVPTTEVERPSPSAARTKWVIPAALAACALIIGGAVIIGRQGPPDWTVVSSQRLVSTPLIERHPAISPDGTMLAYSAGPDLIHRRIYVRRITSGESLQLSSDAYDDTGPEWSPDGARIAYVASRAGEPCRIMLAPSLKGLPTQVARCQTEWNSRAVWTPTGDALLFSDRLSPDGLEQVFRLDLASGARVPVTRPPADMNDFEPILSFDGRWIVFIRQAGDTAGHLIVHDLRTGAERALAVADSFGGGYAWADDDRSVFAVDNHGQDSVIWSYPLDGGPRRQVASVPLSLGRLASARGGLLAAEIHIYRSDPARPPARDGDQPVVLDPGKAQTWSLAYSPDGVLAIVSDRSGETAIWLRPSKGGAARQLMGLGAAKICCLTWSPDGGRLAFSEIRGWRFAIRVVSLSGADLAALPVPASEVGPPVWTQDGKALLFPARDGRGWSLWRADLTAPAAPVRVIAPGWRSVARGPAGLFGVKAAQPGIWRLDGTPHLVTTALPASLPQSWTQFKDRLVFASENQDRLLSVPITGGQPRLFAFTPKSRHDLVFSVDPTSGAVAYVALLEDDSDINLFKLARR